MPSKTNRERVAELRAEGRTYRSIADELGISTQRVWQLLKLIEKDAAKNEDPTTDGVLTPASESA